MTLRDRLDDKALLRIGCVFLIAASLWKWFVHPTRLLSEGLVDGSTGLLYGVAIGALLLSVRRSRRRRARAE